MKLGADPCEPPPLVVCADEEAVALLDADADDDVFPVDPHPEATAATTRTAQTAMPARSLRRLDILMDLSS
jgi:hypothetical protein